MINQAEPKSDTRVRELDALRGIAAMAVVLFHLITAYYNVIEGASRLPFDFEWGLHGVDLFFAISGFVIYMTLSQTRTVSDFLVSRFSRLFPAFWLAVLVTSAIVLAIGPEKLKPSLATIAINMTMLQDFFSQRRVDEVYWTLSYELAFYAWMLLFWRLRLLDCIETTLICAMIIYCLVVSLVPLPQWLFTVFLVGFIHFFAIGVASYRVWSGARRWEQQAPLLFAAFLTGILFELGFNRPQGEVAAFTLLVTAIMIAVSLNRLSWLRHPVLLWLGAISYPLYLVHQNISYSIMAQLDARGVPVGLALMVALGITLFLSTAINRWVEMPALRTIRAAWRTRKQNRGAASLAA